MKIYEYIDNQYQSMLNYRFSQNDEFNHLTIILTLPLNFPLIDEAQHIRFLTF